MVITTPIFILSGLGLRRILSSDGARRFPYRDCFRLRLFANIVSLAAVVVLLPLTGFSGEAAGAILAAGLAKAIESSSDLALERLHAHGRLHAVGRSLLLRGSAGVGGLAIGRLAGGGAVEALLGMGSGWLLVLLVHDLPFARRLPEDPPQYSPGKNSAPRSGIHQLARLAELAFPKGVPALLGSLLVAVPALAIARHLGAGPLGLYSALYVLSAAGARLVAAWSEGLSRVVLAPARDAGDARLFARIVGSMVAAATGIGGSGVLLSLALGRPVLSLFLGERFARESELLVALLSAGILTSVQAVLDVALRVLGRVRTPVFLTAGAAVGGSVLASWWVPAQGLLGAIHAVIEMSAALALASTGILLHDLRAPHWRPKRAVLRAA
jgi:O-antigen/teichoic acid export membrane protein